MLLLFYLTHIIEVAEFRYLQKHGRVHSETCYYGRWGKMNKVFDSCVRELGIVMEAMKGKCGGQCRIKFTVKISQALVLTNWIILSLIQTLYLWHFRVGQIAMVQYRSWKNYIQLQDIIFSSKNTKFHYCVHRSTPLSFLRSWQQLRRSRNFPHFGEPKGSLPWSKEHSTGPYSELVHAKRFVHVRGSV
jgi:hypothetical protein